MKQHRLFGALVLALSVGIFGGFPQYAAADDGGTRVVLMMNRAEMEVNGDRVPMSGAPKISAGRTFVPLRATAEAFGAEVAYHAADRSITIKSDNRTVAMGINRTLYELDNERHLMDVAPYLDQKGVTMVPVRFISEALGYAVSSETAKGLTAAVVLKSGA